MDHGTCSMELMEPIPPHMWTTSDATNTAAELRSIFVPCVVKSIPPHFVVNVTRASGGAPDVLRAQRSYLATSMGKVLCRRFGLSSRAGHLCGCNYFGQSSAKTGIGPFQRVSSGCHLYHALDCDMFMGRSGGYAFFVAKVFALLRGHFGVKLNTFRVYSPQK